MTQSEKDVIAIAAQIWLAELGIIVLVTLAAPAVVEFIVKCMA